MDSTPHNENPEPRQPQRDGLAAHWPRLVIVLLALVGLLLVSPQGRARLGGVLRALTPGLSTSTTPSDAVAAEPVPSSEAERWKQLYETERENRKALHECLYGRKYDDCKIVDAEVIKRDPYEGYYTGDLHLNRGTKSNIRIGMAVLRDRVVIGRIVAVDKVTSTLRLITHPDMHMSIRVPGRDLCGMTNAAKGMAVSGEPAMQFPLPSLFVSAIQADEAEGTGRIRDKREPQYLRPGDPVVTDGVSDPANFADGLPVGRVSHNIPVETDTSGWPLRARLIPGRLDSLRYVKIVIPPALPAAVPENHATPAGK